jgi:hypothetical protein
MPLASSSFLPVMSAPARNLNITTQLTPQEAAATGDLMTERIRGGQQRGAIDTFYLNPAREQEVSAVPQAQTNLGFATLRDALHSRAQQEAFARARAGLGGGSVHAEQVTDMRQDATQAGMQLAAQQAARVEDERRRLEAERIQELIRTFQLNPAAQASITSRLGGVTADSDRIAAEARIRAAQEADAEFANDELSRIGGNMINIGANAYNAYQLNSAYLRPSGV